MVPISGHVFHSHIDNSSTNSTDHLLPAFIHAWQIARPPFTHTKIRPELSTARSQETPANLGLHRLGQATGKSYSPLPGRFPWFFDRIRLRALPEQADTT
jgi:hypothetical protein